MHIFASPSFVGELSPPHVIFLPLQSNATNEPALLLISPSGSIRFWSSIFLGLAGADRFVEEKLTLNLKGVTAETVTMAKALISSTYNTKGSQGTAIPYICPTAPDKLIVMNPDIIASTSKGRIFRILVSRKGDSGDWSISTRQVQEKLAKTGGLFSGLFGFGTSPTVSRFNSVANSGVFEGAGRLEDNDANINAVVMGAVEADGVDVWILSSSNLEVWRVSDNLAESSSGSSVPGTERLICKANALTGVQEKLLELYPVNDDTSGGISAPGTDTGPGMAGGLSMQTEDMESRILALGVELLDVVLIKAKSRVRPVDPREPSITPGSRNESDTEMEPADGMEELTPVFLVSFTVPPSGRSSDTGGISWQSTAASSKKGPKRQERSYATIACRFVGASHLTGSQASPIQSLRFEKPTLLPYSDLVNSKTSGKSTASPGVSIGLGVSKSPGAKEGWFAPRLAALQATVTKGSSQEGDDTDDEDQATEKQWHEKSITVLVATFEGGMVFVTNGTLLCGVTAYF